MSRFITDPVEISEELPKWQGKEVTAYVTLNEYTELALMGPLERTPAGTWRICLGTKNAATAILFTAKGVMKLVETDEGKYQVSIRLSLPTAALTAEFS